MTVKNDLSELKKIFDDVEAICTEYKLSEDLCNNLCLCIDEIFSNIIKYAYNDDKEHEIDIVFDFNERERIVKITVTDDGVPFNPLEAKQPDLFEDLLEREIGSLGIYIVLNIMCKIEYNRINNKNNLVMSKKVD